MRGGLRLRALAVGNHAGDRDIVGFSLRRTEVEAGERVGEHRTQLADPLGDHRLTLLQLRDVILKVVQLVLGGEPAVAEVYTDEADDPYTDENGEPYEGY